MRNKDKIRWLTRTGVLLALLVAFQWSTAPTQAFAGQYITGSLVNCVLAVAALIGGLYCGLTIALVSPFCAFALGVGPKLLQVVPAIALGNAVLVVVLWLLYRQNKPFWHQELSVLLAAVCKFGMLYLAVVKVLIPVMGPALPLQQANVFQVMFSYPQAITAAIGGTVALLILPLLRKAIK